MQIALRQDVTQQLPVCQLPDQLVGARPLPVLLQAEDRPVAIGVGRAQRMGDGGGGVEVNVGRREGGGLGSGARLGGGGRRRQHQPGQAHYSGGHGPPPEGSSTRK
jgi:hypothetical protein